MLWMTKPLAAALLLGIASLAAGAQTESPPRDRAPGKTLPGTPPPGDDAGAPRQEAPSGSSRAPDSLSNQLNRSGGVLQPPETGDQGVVPPPNEGSSRTPVIPPPGTPGGKQDIRPK